MTKRRNLVRPSAVVVMGDPAGLLDPITTPRENLKI